MVFIFQNPHFCSVNLFVCWNVQITPKELYPENRAGNWEMGTTPESAENYLCDLGKHLRTHRTDGCLMR